MPIPPPPPDPPELDDGLIQSPSGIPEPTNIPPPPEEPPDGEGSDALRMAGRVAMSPVYGWRSLAVGAGQWAREKPILATLAAGESPLESLGRVAARAGAASEPGFVPADTYEKVTSSIGSLIGVTPVIVALGAGANAVLPAAAGATLPVAAGLRAAHGAATFGALSALEAPAEKAAMTGELPTITEEGKAILKGGLFGMAMGGAGAIPALVAGRLPAAISQGIYKRLAPRVFGTAAEAAVGGSAAALEGGGPDDIAINGIMLGLMGWMGNKNFDPQFKQAAINSATKKIRQDLEASGVAPDQARPMAEKALQEEMVQTVRNNPNFQAGVKALSETIMESNPLLTKESAEMAARSKLDELAVKGDLTGIDQLATMKPPQPVKGDSATTELPNFSPPAAPEGLQVPKAPEAAEAPPAKPGEAPEAIQEYESGDILHFKSGENEADGRFVGYDPETGDPQVRLDAVHGDESMGRPGEIRTFNPAMAEREPAVEFDPLSDKSLLKIEPAEMRRRFGVDEKVVQEARNLEEQAHKSMDLSVQQREFKEPPPDRVKRWLIQNGGIDREVAQRSSGGFEDVKTMDLEKSKIFRNRGGKKEPFSGFDTAAEAMREAIRTGDPLLEGIAPPEGPNDIFEMLDWGERKKADMVREPDPRYEDMMVAEDFSVPEAKNVKAKDLSDWLPERLKAAMDSAKIKVGSEVTSKGSPAPGYGRIKRGETGTLLGVDLESGKLLVRFGKEGTSTAKIVISEPRDIKEVYKSDKELGGGQPTKPPPAREVKKQVEAATGITEPPDELTNLTRSEALRIDLSNREKASIVGANFARREALVNARKLAKDEMAVRGALNKFIREGLSGLEIGNVQVAKLNKLVAEARTEFDFNGAIGEIEDVVNTAYGRQLNTEIQNVWERSLSAPGVAAEFKRKIAGTFPTVDFDAIGKPKPETVERRQQAAEYVEHAQATGQIGQVPASVRLEAARANKRPLNEIGLAEREEIRDVLMFLEKSGRAAQKHKDAIRQFMAERILNPLLEAVKPIPHMKRAPAKTIKDLFKEDSYADAFAEGVARTVNAAQDFAMAVRSPDVMMDLADGAVGYNGPHSRLVKASIDDGYHNAQQSAYSKLKPIMELERTDGPLDKNESRQVGIWLLKEQGMAKRVMETKELSGLPEAERKALVNAKLSKKEMKYAMAMRAIYNNRDNFELTARIAREVLNVDVVEVPNYSPAHREGMEMGEMEMGEWITNEGANRYARRKSPHRGALESRKEGAQGGLELDAMKVLLSHVDKESHFQHMYSKLDILSKVFNNERYLAKAGPELTDQMREYVSLLQRQGSAGAARRNMHLAWLRGHVGAFHLGMRVTAAMVQATQYPFVVRTYGAGAAKFGIGAMFDKAHWEFLQEQVPEWRNRSSMYSQLEGIASNKGKYERAVSESMLMLQKGDVFFAGADFWAGYYSWHRARGIKVDLANPNRAAIQYATRGMVRHQGSPIYKDLNMMLSSGRFVGNVDFARTLFQFDTYTFSGMDHMIHEGWTLGLKKGHPWDAATMAMAFTASVLLDDGIHMGYRSVLNSMIGGGNASELSKQDEYWKKYLGSMLNRVPVVNKLYAKYKYPWSIPVPTVDAVFQTSRGMFGTVAAASMGETAKAVGNAATALTGLVALSGIPAAGLISSTVSQVYKSLDDKPERAPKNVANPKQEKQSKPFTIGGRGLW